MADNTTQGAADVIATDDVTTLNGNASSGIKVQRVKVCYGDDNTSRDVSDNFPLPVIIWDANRTEWTLFATSVAAGATGVETLITLTRSSGAGVATTSASTFVIPSGRRLKITSITFAARGSATATAQATTFSIRANSAGAITTTSAALLSARVATPSTANAWDRVSIPLPDGGLEINGTGTLQIGVSANAVFVTSAPTWDCLITG